MFLNCLDGAHPHNTTSLGVLDVGEVPSLGMGPTAGEQPHKKLPPLQSRWGSLRPGAGMPACANINLNCKLLYSKGSYCKLVAACAIIYLSCKLFNKYGKCLQICPSHSWDAKKYRPVDSRTSTFMYFITIMPNWQILVDVRYPSETTQTDITLQPTMDYSTKNGRNVN